MRIVHTTAKARMHVHIRAYTQARVILWPLDDLIMAYSRRRSYDLILMYDVFFSLPMS